MEFGLIDLLSRDTLCNEVLQIGKTKTLVWHAFTNGVIRLVLTG